MGGAFKGHAFFGIIFEGAVRAVLGEASGAAAPFTCAVTSDGVHRIVACWVLTLQSFGTEQIGHTRWPTNKFAHACVEAKHISIPFSCILSRNKAEIGATSFASVKYSAFTRLVMVHWSRGFKDEHCWVVLWSPQ